MKAEQIHDMTDVEIRRSIDENKQELFNLRFQISTRKIKNHQRIPVVKRDIARLMTALRERELMRIYAGADAETEPGETAPVVVEQAPRRRGLFRRNG